MMIDYTALTPAVVESMARVSEEEGLYTVAWVLRELQADRVRLAKSNVADPTTWKTMVAITTEEYESLKYKAWCYEELDK